MEFKQRTLMQIADMICGNYKDNESFFIYRSSSRLTEFFYDCSTDYVHDGSTRNYWVASVLKEILAQPKLSVNVLPENFLRVIRNLMDQSDAHNEGTERLGALTLLNTALSREGFEAVAEIYNQVTMMLGHEIFDPETNKRVLVDHAFIVAGGEITKAAKNWIGNKLDATKRSQIMFMERDDILNLFIVTNLPLPTGALPVITEDNSIPF